MIIYYLLFISTLNSSQLSKRGLDSMSRSSLFQSEHVDAVCELREADGLSACCECLGCHLLSGSGVDAECGVALGGVHHPCGACVAVRCDTEQLHVSLRVTDASLAGCNLQTCVSIYLACAPLVAVA